MFRICIVGFFCLLVQFCSAQFQNNNWIFGYNGAITFNSGIAVAIDTIDFDGGEGSATISDENGQLLFYTKGDTVWNRDHVVMLNGTGLLGHYGATQSSLIVKRPESSNVYYLFTVPSYTMSEALVYSEVDMTLNGGLGGVTLNKNIPLLPNTTEKLTGARHANGIDYWVIAHEYGTNAFYFYLVNSNSVGSVINVSNVGTVVQGVDELKQGYMRVTIDGSILAMTNEVNGKVELFQFNNEFGFLYDEIILDGFYGAYGLEFSPDNEKLYLTRWNETNSSSVIELIQFDLSYWHIDSIMNSAQVIDTVSGSFRNAIALGSDGVIYVAHHLDLNIGAILEPDLAGPACQYVDSALWLGPINGRQGLPNFIKEPLDPSLNIGQIPQQEELIKAWWADGTLNFELLATPAGNWDLNVHDLAGRTVAELNERSEQALQLSTSQWNTGVYVWRWNNGTESRFGKVYVH